jgi:hypothetical protein
MIATIIDTLIENCPEDVEPWRGVMDDHVHLRIGCRPPVLGREPAMSELRAFFSRVSSIGRPYREIWRLRQATLLETELCWAHLPIPRAGVPCVLIVRTGGRPAILDLRMYLDLSLLEGHTTSGWPLGH